ncbi:8-oxoguanine DNA glycosylase OGG fold protein [Streptomyces sp. NBC_00525]|uniref:8-oxoguanine DNA glycosylase OGG fold protein n=1 Tax=Streptomyces sp. NBC_00525 TaxID=2903660 RepID=UPI002E818E94|nr:hypothetical protein [Streptomyces sp. NBC_00525]WUC93425.1 hypothetical protein OG710_07285 [Streptomyces sp. NBC_00525]
MTFDQSRADELDGLMLGLPLPDSAVRALGQWLADPERGGRYAGGSGAHAVSYVPGAWTAVEPWPAAFADRSAAGPASVSRADVVAVVREAGESEDWARAFVATQLWGYGDRGYGSYRTRRVLAGPAAGAALAESVSLLVDEGAVAAYEALNTLGGLGPSFLTKFLYFAGLALPEVRGPRPLILDRVLAGVLRRYASEVGRAAGREWSGAIAGRMWRDGGWTSHRYDVYLRWMHAAHARLVGAGIDWPDDPGVLELALFGAAWNPEQP